MDIRFQTQNSWQCDVALFFAFDEDTPQSIEEKHAELYKTAPWLSIAPAWRDFDGKAKSTLLLYGHKDNDISRAYIVGLGKKEKCTLEVVRHATALAAKACRKLKVSHIGLDIQSLNTVVDGYNADKNSEKHISLDYLIEEMCTAALASMYRYVQYKTNEDDTVSPQILSLLLTERFVPDEVQNAARLAEANYSGMALARDLANMPANVLTPIAFAEKAESLAKKYDFTYSALNQNQIEELGMNAYLAVAKGSSNEARCIFLEYTPKNCVHEKPYIFVGKGLTFDSGGISLKPSKGMEEMKTDMSGAGDVLGLFETLGQAKMVREPNRPIIGILACAENMPDGNSVKPGDVIRTFNGKTVEITNTDAEGRLVLIDALAYAQKKYSPEIIIDIATLTGACVVALGTEAAGLFANDENLATALLSSSDNVGEILWRMPLWPHMLKKIESPIADLDNAGSRDGGAITAAVFIQQFIEENQIWAHLDIAGPNFGASETPLCTKGGTSFGVRILADFIWNN